ncbi:histidine phosphatase family protein [Cohnella luojiensis]|uniref:Histidine phosphatase family protein n=1 Tax=Cohnella luojiensis TaxID=652876 RepID=A0A4Y8LNZ3_9BACL|nr:histidine phosphatase family protein [Cohnella luojiensis]TFE19359.1 histidine phosphatase family protein [Cohnella luojiensis]
MKTIYLIRHCKAKGQEPDAVLTLEGLAQSESLSDFLLDKQIDLVISSPFLRAIHSIKPFIDLTKVSMKIDSRLSERILCSVELTDWMDKLKVSFDDMDLKLPGGESSVEATNRGIEVINELMNESAYNIVIVTHGNLLSLIIRNFKKDFGFNEWKEMKNPDVFKLIIEQDKYSLERIWK